VAPVYISEGRAYSRAAERAVYLASWDDALRAAGLNPSAIRLHREPWTPDQVLQEIQRKAQAGEPLKRWFATGFGKPSGRSSSRSPETLVEPPAQAAPPARAVRGRGSGLIIAVGGGSMAKSRIALGSDSER
jgi:hypothetical protein